MELPKGLLPPGKLDSAIGVGRGGTECYCAKDCRRGGQDVVNRYLREEDLVGCAGHKRIVVFGVLVDGSVDGRNVLQGVMVVDG